MSHSELASTVLVAVDHLLEGVQVIGRDWTYVYVNAVAAGHAQRAAEELTGRRMTDCYPGIEKTAMFKALEHVMHTRRPERLLNEFTYPSGERRWFELSVEPVPAGICVLSLDITERRAAEHQLQQAQKMEVVGQLASGVAHDFNNILTVVLGYAELVSAQIGPDKPIGRDLEEIVAASMRGAALARQLVGFSRPASRHIAPLHLATVVEGLRPMLTRLLPDNIEVRTAIDPATYAVVANHQQLEQVLMNLVVNARDAMVSGGVITIRTGNVTLDAEYVRTHPGATAGEHAVLSVSDSGCGMPLDVQSRIFEPFFTTKPEGLGTGLGLAVVMRIVRDLHGDVSVYSEPGHGAVFKVYLPRAEAALEAPRERLVHHVSPVGHETVLIVEDEPGVRAFTGTVLRRHGYHVVACASGEAALQHADSAAAPDLLITDLMMPGMGGRELSDRLRARYPGLRILTMSGYSEPNEGLPEGAVWLEKPFTAHELLARVRDLLDAP